MADLEYTVNNKQLVATKKMLQEIKTISDSIKIGGGTGSGKGGAARLSDELKQAEKVQQQVKKTWQETTRIITTQNDELIRARQVRQQETTEAKRRITIANAEKGSYESLNASLNKNISAWKKLSQAERDNEKIGGALLTTITKQDIALKKLDATIGRNQRNVGNYRSGFNGLNTSINQITRELPVLGMNMNTFFLAISNNIPMLTDEISKLNNVNAQLREEGKQQINVWKQVLRGVISWQTAMSIGVALLTIYGAKLVEWIGKQIRANKATETATKLQNQLNTARKEAASSMSNEVTKLRVLYAATQDNNRSMSERKKAADEMQRLYPDYLGNLTQEEILTGKAAGKYEELRAQIWATAKARAYEEKVTENQKEILKLDEERDELLKKQADSQTKLLALTGSQDQLSKDAAKAEQIRYDRVTNKISEVNSEMLQYAAANEELIKSISVEDLLKSIQNAGSETNTEVREAAVNLKYLGDSLSDVVTLWDQYNKSIEEVSKSQEVTIDDIIKGNVKLAESTTSTYDEMKSSGKSYFDELARLEEELATTIKESTKQIFVDAFTADIDENLAIFKDNQDAKEDVLKQRLDDGLISESAYEEQVAALRLKTRQEEAKAEKKKALFEIAVNTAIAAIKQIATVPLPVGAPLLALVLGIGAAQAAAVAAKPIPAYDKGTLSTPDTFLAAEKRPEFVGKNGKYKLLTKPTLFTGSAGMEVVSGRETAKIMQGKKEAPAGLDDSRIVSQLARLNNKPVSSVDITKAGMREMIKKGNMIVIRKTNF